MQIRKLVTFLVLCTLIPAGLFAAGSKEASSDEMSGTIIVLHHRTDWEAQFNEYRDRFNEKYPDITVEFEAITDYAATVRTRMSTRSYGDVLMMVTQPPIPQDFANLYEPMGTVEELSQKYDLIESSQQLHYDGIVYGLPLNANAGGLVYNKRVFEQAGIEEFPTSSDEFYAMLEKIKSSTDAIPIYMNYPSKWTLVQWEGARMAYAGDPDYGNSMIHDDAPFSPGKAHYELYKVMYEVVRRGLCERDMLTADWENSKQMMADGKIGVMNLGSWALGQIQALAANPEDIGYMPYPVSHGGKVYAEAALDYNLAVNKNSENKAAAIAFAKWFAEESGYAADNKSIPVLKGSEFPSNLQAFKDLGVVFLTPEAPRPGEDGLFDKIDNEAEIGLWADPQKIRIVDAAMGTTNEDFDDIMEDWNARWAKARKTLGVNN